MHVIKLSQTRTWVGGDSPSAPVRFVFFTVTFPFKAKFEIPIFLTELEVVLLAIRHKRETWLKIINESTSEKMSTKFQQYLQAKFTAWYLAEIFSDRPQRMNYWQWTLAIRVLLIIYPLKDMRAALVSVCKAEQLFTQVVCNKICHLTERKWQRRHTPLNFRELLTLAKNYLCSFSYTTGCVSNNISLMMWPVGRSIADNECRQQ